MFHVKQSDFSLCFQGLQPAEHRGGSGLARFIVRAQRCAFNLRSAAPVVVHQFLCKVTVSKGTLGVLVVIVDGLSVAGGFADADVAGDNGLENLSREVFLHLCQDLRREVQPPVVHRNQDSLNVQRWVVQPPNLSNGIGQLGQAFQSVKLTLNGDQHRMRTDQRVQRQQAEGGRTVDKDVIKLHGARLKKRIFQGLLPFFHIHELHLCARKIHR